MNRTSGWMAAGTHGSENLRSEARQFVRVRSPVPVAARDSGPAPRRFAFFAFFAVQSPELLAASEERGGGERARSIDVDRFAAGHPRSGLAGQARRLRHVGAALRELGRGGLGLPQKIRVGRRGFSPGGAQAGIEPLAQVLALLQIQYHPGLLSKVLFSLVHYDIISTCLSPPATSAIQRRSRWRSTSDFTQ